MAPFADLHTHTTASDGVTSPRELVRKFLSYSQYTTDNALAYLDDEMRMHESLNLNTKYLHKKAARMTEVARDLRTLGKLDHNTFLGTEEMLDELRLQGAHEKGKRFVLGTEISAPFVLPYKRNHSIHLPVYFYDTDGFDLAAKTEMQQRDFLSALTDSYGDLMNQIVDGVNLRWLIALDKTNVHFPTAGLTADDLFSCAKKRLESVCDPASAINTSNQHIPLIHMDIVDLLYERGIGESPQKIAAEYFGREGSLYTPFVTTINSVCIESLFQGFRKISKASKVKAIVGIAHPGTYIRAIAKARIGENFYQTDEEDEAFQMVGEIIDLFSMAGNIDFIEAECPEYIRKKPDQASMLRHVILERDFSNRVNAWAARKAHELGLGISGGSDYHGTFFTPDLGYGFSDLAYDDSHVDSLFMPKDAAPQ
jgi:hypothetical protein